MSFMRGLFACACLTACATQGAASLSETGAGDGWDEFRAHPPVTWDEFRAAAHRQSFAPYPYIVDGDFNGDGTSDILWHNVSTGEFAEWIMGNGTVASVITLFTEPLEWHIQGTGNFNGQ